jgi:hypothetical protein
MRAASPGSTLHRYVTPSAEPPWATPSVHLTRVPEVAAALDGRELLLEGLASASSVRGSLQARTRVSVHLLEPAVRPDPFRRSSPACRRVNRNVRPRPGFDTTYPSSVKHCTPAGMCTHGCFRFVQ